MRYVVKFFNDLRFCFIMGSVESNRSQSTSSEHVISSCGFNLKPAQLEAGIGSHQVWPCGTLLSQSILSDVVSVKGLRVVELGCGLGIASLAAGQAGASSVSATDRDDLHAAVERNIQINRLNGTVRFHALDWAEPESSGLRSNDFDIVIAADVIYYEEQDPLLLALRWLLRGGNNFAVIAYRERSELDRDYLENVVLIEFECFKRSTYDREGEACELLWMRDAKTTLSQGA